MTRRQNPTPTTPATINRRQVLAGVAGAAAAASLGPSAAQALVPSVAGAAAAEPLPGPASGRKPNVVIILADDTGWGAFGPYGQQTLESPVLDQMAEEGIAFTNTYAGAPICAPSRCSLLTGMHTGHARVRDNSFVETGLEPELLPEDITFAEVLKRGGYATGVFGKWGFGPDDCYVKLSYGLWGDLEMSPDNAGHPEGPLDQNVGHHSHPLQKGFDEFHGLVRHHHATEGYWPAYMWDGNQRVLVPENDGFAQNVYAPEAYVDRCLQFIERNAGDDQPFCAFLSLQNAHWPNHVPSTEPYSDRVGWTEEQKKYAAQVTLIDTYTGLVRDQLERLGLAEDTVVFVTSDNGPTEERAAVGSGESSEYQKPDPSTAVADILWDMTGGLRSKKHSMYDGGLRVPMIVWGPGWVRPNAGVADRPWQFADMLPTLADLAGVEAPADVDGVSVRGWLTGETAPEDRPLYFERPPYLALNADGRPPGSVTYCQVVRQGKWKCLRYALGHTDPNAPDEQWDYELFDMDADRGETTNVALLHPEVVEAMTATMKASHAPKPYAREPWPPK